MKRASVRRALVAATAMLVVVTAPIETASAAATEAVDIGMPLAGSYGNATYGSYPSTHGPIDGNGWAADLYANGVPVRPRFSNPTGTLSLSIAGVGNTCTAGRTVAIDVAVDGVPLGRVRYGHLASVPNFAVGQAISTDTVLGNTQQWTYSTGCWEVSFASGIHTHMTASNSCYVALASAASLGEGDWIGTMGGQYQGTTRTACTSGSGGQPDTDRDGIPDAQDRCPTVPGTPGRSGCPATFDIDGNGKDDLTVYDGTTLKAYGWNGNANGFGPATASAQTFGTLTWAGLGDIDGNGKDDLTVYDGTTLKAYGWNGNANGFGPATASAQTFGTLTWAGLGDIDGNGKDDLTVYDGTTLKAYGWNGNANGFGPATASAQTFGTLTWAGLGDIDGNGKDDLTVYDGTTLKAYGWNGNANGFGPATASAQTFGTLTWAGLGDIDGNGKDDLTVYDGTTLKAYGWNGNANGFGPATASAQTFGTLTWAGLGDIDGNGKDDLTVYDGTTLKAYGWNGNANGFGPATASAQTFGTLTWANGSFAQTNGSGSRSVPSQPRNVTAAAGDGKATVSFDAPARNGGAPITSYTVVSSPGGITAAGTTSPIVVNGLTNGVPYTFAVRATNAVGNGGATATATPVTPTSAATIGQLQGTIAGATGAASGAMVRAYPSGRSAPTAAVRVSSDGAWTMTMPTGTYRIEIVPPSGRYRRTWIGGDAITSATPVTVSGGQVNDVGTAALIVRI